MSEMRRLTFTAVLEYRPGDDFGDETPEQIVALALTYGERHQAYGLCQDPDNKGIRVENYTEDDGS